MISAIIQAALDCGADGAQYLPGSAVITDPAFRKICEGNACGKFDKCYMCPPDIGSADALMAQIHSYPHAVLYQTIGKLEDSFDFEGMMEAGRSHNLCSQRIRRTIMEMLPHHLHLTGGGCHLCVRCGKLDGIPCRHPNEALPSLEGYGIDVYRTAQSTSLRYINGENTVTYFGIILFSEDEKERSYDKS